MPVPYPQASYLAPKTSYKRISVLLMHFRDDGIGCDDLEQELAGTFRTFYCITDITHVLLNNDSPFWTVVQTFTDLLARGCTTKDSLVILAFTGYGRLQLWTNPFGLPDYRSMVGGACYNDGSFHTRGLDWLSATEPLHTTECDVLHIMNCCYVPLNSVYCAHQMAEVLAATSSTSGASANQCKSFMNALIHEFRRLSSRPFTISTLYTELIKNQSALGLQLTPLYSEPADRDSIIFNNSGRAPSHSTMTNTQHHDKYTAP